MKNNIAIFDRLSDTNPSFEPKSLVLPLWPECYGKLAQLFLVNAISANGPISLPPIRAMVGHRIGGWQLGLRHVPHFQ
jgi:hypothetical protein